MNRLIFALAMTPALITTGAFAQTVADDVSKQLWCGSAFVAAFANPPPGVPDDQLALAKVYIDQGNGMIDEAGQKYLDAGFTEEQLTKVKADLVTEVTAAVSGSGGTAKYTFDECKALMPNPPSAAPTADPSAPADPSAMAPDASSSAAQ
jgi:hypothetical protein